MLTLNQIHVDVMRHRPISRRHLIRVVKLLGIQRLGGRQNPDRYPKDTVDRVLAHYGFRDYRPDPVVAIETIRKAGKGAK